MADPSTGLDITTAAIIVGIAFCATCAAIVPAVISEWRVKRRNDAVLAAISKSR